VARLSKETPANYLVFDLLVDPRGRSLVERPLSDRRKLLESFFERLPPGGDIHLSPADPDRRAAVKWMKDLAPSGFDGVIAKRLEAGYRSGDRTGMVKIKRMRTADCVVGGFRYDQNGREIGSLLLGLYNAEGRLDHVGFTSSFTADERRALKDVVLPLRGPAGFTGKAPGGLSRWSTRRSMEWESLKPTLVCEVKYDHFSGDRVPATGPSSSAGAPTSPPRPARSSSSAPRRPPRRRSIFSAGRRRSPSEATGPIARDASSGTRRSGISGARPSRPAASMRRRGSRSSSRSIMRRGCTMTSVSSSAAC
jgi:ATP-dependent DNA ligase